MKIVIMQGFKWRWADFSIFDNKGEDALGGYIFA